MRIGSLALVLTLVLASMATAATLQRSWETRDKTSFEVGTEVFVLYDNDDEPRLRPFRPHENSEVLFRLPADPARNQPLHMGEVDRVGVFVICSATQDPAKPNAEGEGDLDFTRLAYGVNLVFVVPDGSLVPHRWVPKTQSLSNGGRDLRDMLVARGLIPDEEADVYVKRGTKPFTFEELNTLFTRIEAGELDHAVDLKAEAGRKRGYVIPSTIESASLKVTVDGDMNIRVQFDDPGVKEEGQNTRYDWTMKGFFLWSKKIEGSWTANGAASRQDFTVTSKELNPDAIFTLSVSVSKPGYGAIPVRNVECQFRYTAGTGSEDGDDPFGYEGIESH